MTTSWNPDDSERSEETPRAVACGVCHYGAFGLTTPRCTHPERPCWIDFARQAMGCEFGTELRPRAVQPAPAPVALAPHIAEVAEERARTVVVNKTRGRFTTYIGKGSKWGNPYSIGRDGSRQQVVDKYSAFIRGNPTMLAEVEELRGGRLGCFCKPKRCHGDVLLSILIETREGV